MTNSNDKLPVDQKGEEEMVSAVRRPARPRQQFLIPMPTGDPRLLEPGWAGEVDDDELDFIRDALFRDAKPARLWGFRPSQKSRADEAIRRVALDGDPEKTTHNRGLARRREGATLPLWSNWRS